MPSKKRKYEARFPPARIKKIMQTDEEIGKVAAAVPVIISRSLEIFLQSLVETTAQYTNERKAKTMTTSHLKHCIENEGKFDFLKDLVVNIADISNADEEDTHEGGEKPKKTRKPRAPNTNSEKKKKKKESSSEDDSDAQSDGDESGSAQTSFPSSPNPNSFGNLSSDIPSLNIPPINLPPMDPIQKPSNIQNSGLPQQQPHQSGGSMHRNLPSQQTNMQSPRTTQMAHGSVQSPRNIHSPLNVLSSQTIQSPQDAISPHNMPSPLGIRSPHNTLSPHGGQPSMDVNVPPNINTNMNVPSPLISSPRNLQSPRNVASPSYIPESHSSQIPNNPSKASPLVPQPQTLGHNVASPNLPLNSPVTQHMPMMDGIHPQDTSSQTQRTSHSIDAIMGNVSNAPAPSQQAPQQQFQFKPPPLQSTPSVGSNFMPNFNLQGNGASGGLSSGGPPAPSVPTTFHPNFATMPFQLRKDEDEDDDYDT